MYKRIKNRVFEIIQTATDGNIASRVFDISIIVLIIINVITVIAETFSLPEIVSTIFYYIEFVSVIVFTVEYVLRVWTADLLYPDMSPIKARIKYIFSFMALIDLFAILPFYIPFVLPIDLRVLRVLRIIRLFRIFKVNRYTNALTVIGSVFKKKKHQLISSVFIVALLMVVASVVIYNIENTAQPDSFSNAFDALWWAVATLTTVGYGDIYPITIMGKILSSIIAVLGIGLVAVPTGIISSGFIEVIDEQKKADIETNDDKSFCPYCGHKLP